MPAMCVIMTCRLIGFETVMDSASVAADSVYNEKLDLHMHDLENISPMHVLLYWMPVSTVRSIMTSILPVHIFGATVTVCL